MEAFMGLICHWAPNFAPRGWAFCQGQLLPVAQQTAMFSLLGTTYGCQSALKRDPGSASKKDPLAAWFPLIGDAAGDAAKPSG